MDSKYYVDVLTNNLISTADKIFGYKWVFQHENTVMHISNLSENILEASSFNLLEWQKKQSDFKLTKMSEDI